jgi:hypothetical protein
LRESVLSVPAGRTAHVSTLLFGAARIDAKDGGSVLKIFVASFEAAPVVTGADARGDDGLEFGF